jgi:hypothetical protein
MAASTVKTTYSLDVDTIRALEELARRWNVAKSEALRRAIRASVRSRGGAASPGPIEALDRLQRKLRLHPREADRWARALRAERSATSRRRARTR